MKGGAEITPCSPSGEVFLPPNPRRTHGRSGRAAVTAGTLTPEGYAVDGVAADPAALDTDSDSTYGHDVEHAQHTLDGLSEGHKSCSTSSTPLAESVFLTHGGRASVEAHARAREVLAEREAEAVRQGRLRRWQAIR